jgi:hypothetical protein
MKNNRLRLRGPLNPGLTADDLADQEDAVADRFSDMGVGDDDVEFLHADANERRRLAAIIREEEKKEEAETRAWKASIKLAKSKRQQKKD